MGTLYLFNGKRFYLSIWNWWLLHQCSIGWLAIHIATVFCCSCHCFACHCKPSFGIQKIPSSRALDEFHGTHHKRDPLQVRSERRRSQHRTCTWWKPYDPLWFGKPIRGRLSPLRLGPTPYRGIGSEVAAYFLCARCMCAAPLPLIASRGPVMIPKGMDSSLLFLPITERGCLRDLLALTTLAG